MKPFRHHALVSGIFFVSLGVALVQCGRATPSTVLSTPLPAQDSRSAPDAGTALVPPEFLQVERTQGRSELLKPRAKSSLRGYSFAQAIWKAIEANELPQRVSMGGNDSRFQVGSGEAVVPVGLWSHPVCKQSAESLRESLGHEPPAEIVQLAQAFADQMALARSDGRRAASGLMARLMGCLAYSESLSTADTKTSEAVAKEVAPSDYSKPPGVKFYLDSKQVHPESRLNIGLYQFSPASRGNVQACLRNWNQWVGQDLGSSLPLEAPEADMIRLLGAADQEFNAFCGVNKIAQTFFVQVNTSSPQRTPLENRGSSGVLKRPEDRCVTPFFNVRAYQHFGPLQNTTRRNLAEVLRCALDSRGSAVSSGPDER